MYIPVLPDNASCIVTVCTCTKYLFTAQDTGNGVQSADVVLYGLGLVIPLMNTELLKVCNVYVCMYVWRLL